MSDDEKLISWEDEANGVIKDIKNFVSMIAVSTTLEKNEILIFLNIKTLEGKEFCVELSEPGFRIVGEEFDKNYLNTEDYFDTPYSLLSSISPSYDAKFASSLAEKLRQLSRESCNS